MHKTSAFGLMRSGRLSVGLSGSYQPEGTEFVMPIGEVGGLGL